MGKGYALESETEAMLMKLASQNRDIPMWDRCHRVPTSGAHRGAKGDVISRNVKFFEKQLCIECKRRKHRLKDGSMVFRLPESWITKNEGEAAGQGCLPFFLCAFTGAQKWRKFVVMRHHDLRGFLRHHYCRSIAGPDINKKGTFIFEKAQFDKGWSLLPNTIYSIVSVENRWAVISYQFFVELLEKKKKTWKSQKRS